MKGLIIVLAFALPLTAIAQTGNQKSPPAKSIAGFSISKKDANEMVRFSNALSSFLQEHLTMQNYQQAYEEFAHQVGRSPMYFDLNAMDRICFLFPQNVENYKSNHDNIDPTAIPKCIGATDAQFIKAQLTNYQQATETIMNLKAGIKPYLLPNNYVDTKANKKAANEIKTIIEKMREALVQADAAIDNLQEIGEDIGSKGEEVILSGHPFKQEIMDMKLVMRKALKMTKIMVAAVDVNDVTTKIPATEILGNELIALIKPYEQYANQKSNKDANLRDDVAYFFKNCAEEFLPGYVQFKQDYLNQKESYWTLAKKQKSFRDKYEKLLYRYNAFVSINNHH